MQVPLDLSPASVRTIENGRYTLFDMECPTEVMAAYERYWHNRGQHSRAQEDGDTLVTWVVHASLMKGNFELGVQLRDALEKLGWRPSEG